MCPKLIELLSWNGPTVHVCCFMSARASNKTFRQLNPYSLVDFKKQRKKSSLAEKFDSRVTRQPRYRCTLEALRFQTVHQFPRLNRTASTLTVATGHFISGLTLHIKYKVHTHTHTHTPCRNVSVTASCYFPLFAVCQLFSMKAKKTKFSKILNKQQEIIPLTRKHNTQLY